MMEILVPFSVSLRDSPVVIARRRTSADVAIYCTRHRKNLTRRKPSVLSAGNCT